MSCFFPPLKIDCLDSQVFKAKLHGTEEVAVKVFKLFARIKSEVNESESHAIECCAEHVTDDWAVAGGFGCKDANCALSSKPSCDA